MKNWFETLRTPKQIDELALMKLRERGARAEALLRDETLAEAFVEVEKIYMQAWRGSDALDVELRERAHIAVNLLADLKAQIIHYAREGDAARASMEREVERKKKAA